MIDVDKLVAGPEFDTLIEERIFGRKWTYFERVRINDVWYEVPTWLLGNSTEHDNPPNGTVAGQKPPPRSSDIAAAWEVLEKMRSSGVRMSVMPAEYSEGWIVGKMNDWTTALTAPLAICRAAYKPIIG